MKVRLEIDLLDDEALRLAEYLDPHQREASGDEPLSKRRRVSIIRSELLSVIEAHLQDVRQEITEAEERRMVGPVEEYDT